MFMIQRRVCIWFSVYISLLTLRTFQKNLIRNCSSKPFKPLNCWTFLSSVYHVKLRVLFELSLCARTKLRMPRCMIRISSKYTNWAYLSKWICRYILVTGNTVRDPDKMEEVVFELKVFKNIITKIYLVQTYHQP